MRSALGGSRPMTNWRPHHPSARDLGCRFGARAHAGDVLAHLGDAARVACGADLIVEPHCRELGVRRQSGGDDPGERIELSGSYRILSWWRRLEIARELPGRDPVVHHAAADAETLGDGRLRQAVIEEMLK